MDYDTLPNNVYYDANIINNDQSGTKDPPMLVFQDIRSTSILTYPHLYELSVVRFNLETANSLPLWIPSIQPTPPPTIIPGLPPIYGPPLAPGLPPLMIFPGTPSITIPSIKNINLTTYSFTLEYKQADGQTHTSGQTFVEYEPSDYSAALPTGDDTYIPYYYVKSFNTIVQMFNNALTKALVKLKTVVDNPPSQYPPFFEWNSDTSKFILNADVMGYNLNDAFANYISIYCNSALYTLISGFESDYYGIKAVDGKNYRFKIRVDPRGLNLFQIDYLQKYYAIQLYQEYSSGSLFSPVASIVFTTNMLPVIPSNSSQPTIFSGDGKLRNSGNNNNLTTMITDFESQDNNGYGFCGSLSYIPSAEYRFISMNQGNDKINNIDITVYWKDQYSNLHPFYLLPGCKCDIKILFRKIKNI